MEITLQGGLVKFGGAKELLARPARGCHTQRGSLKAVSVRDQSLGTLGDLSFVQRASLLRELQLVKCAGHRIVQLARRYEVTGEHASGPAPHLVDEVLLSRLSVDVPLNEREDRTPGLGLPVFLVGRGDARGLAIPVAGAEQEHNDVSPAHTSQARLLWRIGGGAEVLRSSCLVSEHSRCPGCDIAKRLKPPNRGTDEDPHRGEYRIGIGRRELEGADERAVGPGLPRRWPRGNGTCRNER